jgi:GR25 family glycosyltransferase involved in LPS biosynthesis
MKGFIHYVKHHKQSEMSAAKTYESFIKHGWNDIEMVEGITPQTIDEGEFAYRDLPGGRLANFRLTNQLSKYILKKSCLFNNIRHWERVVEANEPMMFIEHDALCVSPYEEFVFEDFCFMSYEYWNKYPTGLAINQFRSYTNVSSIGVNKFPSEFPLKYYRPSIYKDSIMTPGTACYAISPKGAQKMLDALSSGLEQSDFIINSANVKLEYIFPSLVKYQDTNLNLSHTLNIL